MQNRTKRACQVCGKPFYGDSGRHYCHECARAKKLDTVVKLRTCQDCGTKFFGGPRARRCTACAHLAQLEVKRQYQRRGTIRPLGSIDKCAVCGAEYVVSSSRQKYCANPNCRRIGVLEWQREHKKGYNAASGQYAIKAERRRRARKICAYCLRTFASSSPTNLCSDHCRREQKRLSEFQARLNRGGKADYDRLLKLREDYREAVKSAGVLSGYSGGRDIDYGRYKDFDFSALTKGERKAIETKIKNPDMDVAELAKICGLSKKSVPALLSRAVHNLDSARQ